MIESWLTKVAVFSQVSKPVYMLVRISVEQQKL